MPMIPAETLNMIDQEARDRAAAYIAETARRRDALIKVLEPFAEAADLQDAYRKEVKAKRLPDSSYGPGVTMGALRAARKALAELRKEAAQSAE